jgi:predicted DNA binding CopG/RHH family protein
MDKRDRKIEVCVSKIEAEQIDKLASQIGLSLSEYLRTSALLGTGIEEVEQLESSPSSSVASVPVNVGSNSGVTSAEQSNQAQIKSVQNASLPRASVHSESMKQVAEEKKQQRSLLVNARVSKDECHLINERARTCGLNRSQYMRLCALGQELPAKIQVPAVNQMTHTELGRIGSLLNQYLRHLNRGGRVVISAELLAELIAQVTAVRRQLIGEGGESNDR